MTSKSSVRASETPWQSRALLLLVLKEFIVLLSVSIISAFAWNAFSGKGIPLTGNWHAQTGNPHAGGPCAPDTNGLSLDEISSLYTDPEYLIIDARTAQDFESGHIPGAVMLPVRDMDEWIESFLNRYLPSQQIIVYCTSVTCDDSDRLSGNLKSYGYLNVRVYPGGFEEWDMHAKPVAFGVDR